MRPDVSVVTAAHDVADARLHRQVAALAARGLTVEVLGLGAAQAGPPGAVVRTADRAGLVRRAWRALSWPWRATGRVLITLDPDVAIGAVAAARVRRRRLVCDVHEDYAALLRDRRSVLRLAGTPVVRVAEAALRAADLVVTADDHVAPGVGRLVLPNLPDPRMLPGTGAPDPSPRAVYVGDLRRSRGLFAMVEALRAAPDWSADLVGPVSPRDQVALDRLLAADADLRARVRLHGRKPPRAAWALAAGAWAGLLLLEDTPAFRAAMPSKLYEYLACGLPVVTTALPRPADLVTRTGAGAVVDSAATAGATLARWSADPAAYAVVRGAARRAAADQDGTAVLTAFADEVAALAGR